MCYLRLEERDVAMLHWIAWIVASYLLKLTTVVLRELYVAPVFVTVTFSSFLGVVFYEIGVPAPVLVTSGVSLRDGLTLVCKPLLEPCLPGYCSV